MHVALVLALSFGANDASGLLLKVGEPAPPFAMRDLSKEMFSLRNHTGPGAPQPKSAVLITFFATWCKPCKAEIPEVQKIYERWQKEGLEVVSVGMSQGAKDLEPFVKEVGVPWRVIPDPFGLLSRRYGTSQLPHLFIIDKAGNLAFQHRGITPDLQQTLEAQLARVTGRAPASNTAPVEIDKPRFTRTLRLGRVPANEASAARWQPLGAYLGEAAESNIEVATESSYEEFEKALKGGKYDLANAGPLLLGNVKELYEPVAKLERQGSATYLGILFTKRPSPIASVGDLKGKKVGLVAPDSTSGGLYPQLLLIEAGLKPGRDVEIVWLGSHEKVAAAVKNGSVDAGGCFEDCRDAAWFDERAKATSTRILSYTSEIPAEMIVVRRGLEPAIKKKLIKAILSIGESASLLSEISQGEKSVTGVVAASETDLNAVREVAARVARVSR